MVQFWVVWSELFGFGQGRVSWFGVFFLQKAHVFSFTLGLQQVINVHLTGAALVNIDCTLCMVKTVLSVPVFVCYLYQWMTLYCVLRT